MSTQKSSKVFDVSSLTVADPEQQVKPGKEKGLGWIVTGLFVIGDIAGGGIVALPGAMMQMDFYPGLVFCTIMTFVAMYTAVVLGEGWVIMRRRWPEYREHCRKPYAEMGYRAVGKHIKNLVSASLAITQFGTAVVFLLLSSKNIGDFLRAFFNIHFSYCYLIIIVGIALLPLIFLKSPQDFWWAVVGAMITTTAALTLVIVGTMMDYGTCKPERSINEKFVITNYFLGLGTLLFSFGGHAAFPTIVNDMKRPEQFKRSSIFAFGAAGLMYIPVSAVGYITYGNSIKESIINSLQITGIQQAVNILITMHCLLALTIIFNPLNQEIEEMLHVPQKFCWQRAAVRTGVMVGVIFVAESLPTFGPLLNIVGGSTLTLTSVVLPAIFYLYLKLGDERSLRQVDSKEDPDKPPTFMQVIKETPKMRLAICGFVIIFGLVGGASATFSAVRELATTKFAVPCYVQPFLKTNNTQDEKTNLNCCGEWQNITRSGESSQCSPFQDYYNQYDNYE